MVEARFDGRRFLCGECGADLGFMDIPEGQHNVTIDHADIRARCGHHNTISKFHKV